MFNLMPFFVLFLGFAKIISFQGFVSRLAERFQRITFVNPLKLFLSTDSILSLAPLRNCENSKPRPSH